MLNHNLNYWLTNSTDQVFKDLKFNTKGRKGRKYAYIDNGYPILAVAHLDTVQSLGTNIRHGEHITYAPGLDDRLGAWTIANLAGVDILLTEGEESGSSTAALFTPDKDYNWIVEFDREGEDVVTYGLDTLDFRSAIESVGFELGFGSYSDISSLDLGCCAVNIGIGTRQSHSVTNHVIWSEYDRQMDRFHMFFNSYRDVAFPLDEFTGNGPQEDLWADYFTGSKYRRFGYHAIGEL